MWTPYTTSHFSFKLQISYGWLGYVLSPKTKRI